MRAFFAGLQTEIPDGWVDDSTITYSMPAEADLGTPTLPSRQPTRGGANVTITWEGRGGGDPETYLQERLAKLGEALPVFKLRDKGSLGEDDQLIAFAEFSIGGEVPMIQLLQVKLAGDRLVCVTGTALEAVYPTIRERFMETARTLGQA